MLLVFPQRDLRLKRGAELDALLPERFLQLLAFSDVGSDASKGHDLSVVVEHGELVNDTGVQQAIAVRRDFLDLDTGASGECLRVVRLELCCELGGEEL